MAWLPDGMDALSVTAYLAVNRRGGVWAESSKICRWESGRVLYMYLGQAGEGKAGLSVWAAVEGSRQA